MTKSTLDEKPPLVISHYPCLDGFTAAWACWLKHPDAEFVHGVHGQPPPDVAGRDVFVLDFSYKRIAMEAVCKAAKTVLILDHHKSAQADLAGLDNWLDGDTVNVVFDMEKSGARLAWEWFHPGVEVPLFVRLVEDRDLWRFALPLSKDMNAYFFSYDYSFEGWTRLRKGCDAADVRGLYADRGATILRKQDKDVKELVDRLARRLTFNRTLVGDAPPSVLCANLPYTLSSDAAGVMAEGEPFAATWYQDAEGWCVFSLRSREGGVDVSEVATRYGGGGHEHAAGFRVRSLKEL